jgi:apolipoprotein N-acyltransferase
LSRAAAGLAVVLAGALGALHALSFAPRPLWALQLLAVVGLAGLLTRVQRPAHAALVGFAFSLAWLVGGVWWLFISMHRYGGLPAWMAALAVLALCAFLSAFFAAAMAAFVRWRPGSGALAALSFAAWWLLAELARGTLFTGFPWVASGYAHADGPLAPLAPWVGVYGLGAWGAFGAALAALALPGPRAAGAARGLSTPSGAAWLPAPSWKARGVAAAGALAMLALPAALPQNFTRPSGSLQVALLQGNVPQDEKFAAERLPETLGWMAGALATAPGDLVVAPETAIPLLPEQLPQGFWPGLTSAFADGRRAALIGLPLGSYAEGYTNSVAGLSQQAAASPEGFYRYDKHHLVPFGEFIPQGFRWFVDLMAIPLGDFKRGPLRAPSFEVRGERVAPNICYEDLFGEELAARFANAAEAPTVLANVSNIAWFGDTVAIDQHLAISRMRALELQRPMLRATNTGPTVIIDHQGRVTHALPRLTQGVLEGRVEGREGLTPYARWAGRFRLWPLIGLALALVAGCAVASSRIPRGMKETRA